MTINYIQKLLQGEKVEWKMLGEVADIVDGFALNTKDVKEQGKYSVIKI